MACVVRGKKDSEGDKNRKVNGRGKEEKNKKVKLLCNIGARENRPLTPTKKDPRAALWTTGTSGKVLFDKPMNTFALI